LCHSRKLLLSGGWRKNEKVGRRTSQVKNNREVASGQEKVLKAKEISWKGGNGDRRFNWGGAGARLWIVEKLKTTIKKRKIAEEKEGSHEGK